MKPVKNKADFLVELLTEELPPKSLLKLAMSFREQVEAGLINAELTFCSCDYYATPRRLAVLVRDLVLAQPDRLVERKGPALQVAFDKDGKPTKACEGFAKSCGVSVNQLQTIQTAQGAWVGYQEKVKGKVAKALLPDVVEQAIKALPIAKRMRWGSRSEEFVRPVHRVVMLLGKQVVAATILGIKADRKTQGHRFMADKVISLTDASSYVATMKKNKVWADFDERRERIRELAQSILPKEMTKLAPDVCMADKLLDEVTGLVEWPVALCGQFDEAFLRLPKEVLVSAMQDHQRYFHVTRKNGALLPYFVTISNIKSKNPHSVIEGNERVLRARLADAAFFYQDDQKESLESQVERLKGMVYQAKLGTLYDKSERISQLSGVIAGLLAVDKEQAIRAGRLTKADLTTNMVGEFPELQGIMGQYYAAIQGEPEAVSRAIGEHYFPRFAGDVLPEAGVSQAVALSDRIDTLVGIFGIRQVPTGDKDPFGLRRAAIGVLRILIEKKLPLDLRVLCQQAVALYDDKIESKETAELVISYLLERLRAYYLDQGVTPDVYASVAALSLTNPLDVHYRIQAVQAFKTLREADMLSAANKRVSNILAKVEGKLASNVINRDIFEHDAEKILADALLAKQAEITRYCQSGDYDKVLKSLAGLRRPVDAFFDQVMVMTEDRAQRENRLLMLSQLRAMFLQVADIALLQ